MFDEIPSPVFPASQTETGTEPVAEPPAPADRLARHTRWIYPVAAAAVALALGTSGTVGGLLFAGWRPPVDREFVVSVYLKTAVTPAQKADVLAALGKLDTVDGVHLETSAQAYAKFQALFKDEPGKMPDIAKDSLPESFQATTIAPAFDCTVVSQVHKLPGVQDTVVVEAYLKKLPGATIACG